jgi:hypothetical protein
MNPPYGGPPASDPGGMPVPRTRFFDLLEQLRGEFDAVVEENRSYHGLREEYQRKVEKQVAELTIMEQSLAELDRRHLAMKEQYDAELARVQAAASGVPGGTAVAHEQAQGGGPWTPQLSASIPTVLAAAIRRQRPSEVSDQEDLCRIPLWSDTTRRMEATATTAPCRADPPEACQSALFSSRPPPTVLDRVPLVTVLADCNRVGMARTPPH